jgi:hypothetical protein
LLPERNFPGAWPGSKTGSGRQTIYGSKAKCPQTDDLEFGRSIHKYRPFADRTGRRSALHPPLEKTARPSHPRKDGAQPAAPDRYFSGALFPRFHPVTSRDLCRFGFRSISFHNRRDGPPVTPPVSQLEARRRGDRSRSGRLRPTLVRSGVGFSSRRFQPAAGQSGAFGGDSRNECAPAIPRKRICRIDRCARAIPDRRRTAARRDQRSARPVNGVQPVSPRGGDPHPRRADFLRAFAPSLRAAVSPGGASQKLYPSCPTRERARRPLRRLGEVLAARPRPGRGRPAAPILARRPPSPLRLRLLHRYPLHTPPPRVSPAAIHPIGSLTRIVRVKKRRSPD